MIIQELELCSGISREKELLFKPVELKINLGKSPTRILVVEFLASEESSVYKYSPDKIQVSS